MTRPDRDVLLCRDCCCGSPTKHPATDHDAQRDRLEAEAPAGVRVRVVDCLDECDRSNVVMVRDFTVGRRPRDTWLGGVLDEGTTGSLLAWVEHGGPVPESLAGRVFVRRRP